MALRSSGIAQGPTIDLIVLYHSICGLDEKTGSLTAKCSTSMLYSFLIDFLQCSQEASKKNKCKSILALQLGP